jgi:hypothetical protein
MRNWLFTVFAILLVLTAGYYTYSFFWGGERLPPPEELARRALEAGSPEEQEKAALDLARSGEPAREHLRRVLAETRSPQVRAAVVEGLGALRDWESMPKLLDLLGDPDVKVRGRAGVAVTSLLGQDFSFRADDSADKRARIIRDMRSTYNKLQKAPRGSGT